MIAEVAAAEDTLRSFFALAGLPASKEYFSSSLTRGQRYEARVPSKDVLTGDAFKGVGNWLKDELSVAYELLAYRLVSGRQTAEIQATVPNVLGSMPPFRLRVSPTTTVTVRLTSLTGTSRDYVDLATGISLAKYESFDLSGYVQGKVLVQRWITSTRLDMANSRI